MSMKKEPVWLEWCRSCKRKHYVTMMPCPSCGVYSVPHPVSDAVANACGGMPECDGCEAYREHTAI